VRARALAVAGAAAAALAVWAVAVPLLGAQLIVRFGGGAAQSVGVDYVVGAGVVGSLAGWGLLALLERHTPRARDLWTGAAVVALLVSLALPLSFGTTAATRVALALMHVAVASVLIPTLRLTSRNPVGGSRGAA
jgi:putative effector of murein hydrolase